MKLRPATADDVKLLRRWDDQPHVIASDPNDDWAWEVELDRTPDWREPTTPGPIASTSGWASSS